MHEDKDFIDFMDNCIKKDKDAWDMFVEKYSPLIYNCILKTFKKYNYFSKNDEVNDIFNDIFLSFIEEDYKRLRNFRGRNERSFLAYVRTICFHITVDYLRKQRNFIELEKVQNFLHNKSSFDYLDQKDLQEIIANLKSDLPERHNYLYEMIYEKEISVHEIANIMKIKINALGQLKFRMIKNFNKIVQKKNLYNELKIFLAESPCIQD